MKLFSFIFKILGALSPVHIWFVTILSGATKIGTDSSGNTYYEAKARAGYNHTRRWVIYKDTPDASAVPPEWHGWLHHQTDYVPSSDAPSYRRSWQKPHRANMTGTADAYHPPRQPLASGGDVRTPGHYTPWVPPVRGS